MTGTTGRLFRVELTCSDRAAHRHRVESRCSDFPDLVVPTWAAVEAREFVPLAAPDMTLDTARHPACEAADMIRHLLDRR